jgi:hypothetical protein
MLYLAQILYAVAKTDARRSEGENISSLTVIEKRYFEDLYGMAGGYVLDFTNDSFAQLFRDTVKIEIYDSKYARNGDSKAKRMRIFWELEPDPAVGKVLSTILELWKFQNDKKGNTSKSAEYSECKKIVNRLLGIPQKETDSEKDFLTHDFGDIKVSNLNIDSSLIPILDNRIKEAIICLKNNLSLSVILLSGSVLEGILLAFAIQNPKEFNQSPNSPKDEQGKVKLFHDWTLANFIDVAYERGFLGLDVKKFSHALRDFRNYIHPYQQMVSKFNPDKHTAEICMQVLKAAIADLSEK